MTYLQIAPTSCSEVPEYALLSRTVSEPPGRINGAHGEPGWVPIHYVTSAYPRSVLAGLYRIARVGLVTPMRDGMNLVAKEHVAAQDPDNPGVLVLSKFAGAAEQLGSALIVNPNDQVEVAEAISEALHMDRAERIACWRRMMDVLRRYDIAWWADAFLKELAGQRRTSKVRSPAPVWNRCPLSKLVGGQGKTALARGRQGNNGVSQCQDPSKPRRQTQL